MIGPFIKNGNGTKNDKLIQGISKDTGQVEEVVHIPYLWRWCKSFASGIEILLFHAQKKLYNEADICC